ncbi:PadR family transcriptional regulator [Candidatus Harpocratesius sp.]
MFSKKIRLPKRNKTISVATALVLMAIDEILQESHSNDKVVYGYQIMSHLRDNYNWNVKSGTVYPILKKLHQDLFIKKGVGPDSESKRQTIFYSITRKGEKLVNEIRSLNDEALEAALTPGEVSDRSSVMKLIKNGFPSSNFAEKYLGPLLRDFCQNVAELIAKQDKNGLSNIEEEIKISLSKLDSVKEILEGELEKIKTLKKL